MDLIKLAEIGKTVGLKGQVRAYCLTDFPAERFKRGTQLTVLQGDGTSFPVTVSFFRDEGRFVVLGFKEWPSIEEAERHLPCTLLIEREKATLPKGYFRLEELKGLDVLDEAGNKLGVVKDVLSCAPTKTLRVGREGAPDFFVPFRFETFIVSIDLPAKKIIIKVMAGLL